MSGSAAKALSGLRVLDLTRVRAGPTCCRILADFGADVIKIEAPDGVDPNEGMSGPRDGYDMLNLHRNKRSLTLNLKKPEGLAVFMDLVKQADVVVENYRPDVKDRLGFGYQALQAVNPRIILCSISGFGEDGPYRNRAGFDQIAQGMGGLMWVTGLPDQGPVRAGIAIADSSAGIYAANGIFIALLERAQSGQGQWVQTSLLQAQIAMCDFQAARWLVDQVVPPQAGNDHPYSTPMGVLPTQDGYINIGVAGDRQWRALCEALQLPDVQKDPRFQTQDDRFKHRPALNEILHKHFVQKTSAHWLALLEAHGIPAGPIYTMDEVFADPQVQHLGMAQTLTHKRRGEVRLVAQPVTLSRTPARLDHILSDKGDDTDQILHGLGYDAERLRMLRDKQII